MLRTVQLSIQYPSVAQLSSQVIIQNIATNKPLLKMRGKGFKNWQHRDLNPAPMMQQASSLQFGHRETRQQICAYRFTTNLKRNVSFLLFHSRHLFMFLTFFKKFFLYFKWHTFIIKEKINVKFFFLFYSEQFAIRLAICNSVRSGSAPRHQNDFNLSSVQAFRQFVQLS